MSLVILNRLAPPIACSTRTLKPLITLFCAFSSSVNSFPFGFFPVHPAVVGSGSMRPLIDTGEVAIITDVPNMDAIEQGDIIQFRAKDADFTIMHRVIEINQEGDTKTKLFVTKGDANKDLDSDPVHPGQITGKVAFVIPKVGWVGIVVRDFIKSIGVRFEV